MVRVRENCEALNKLITKYNQNSRRLPRGMPTPKLPFARRFNNAIHAYHNVRSFLKETHPTTNQGITDTHSSETIHHEAGSRS